MTNAEAHTTIHCLSQPHFLYNIHIHKYLINEYKAVWMCDIYLLYDLFGSATSSWQYTSMKDDEWTMNWKRSGSGHELIWYYVLYFACRDLR